MIMRARRFALQVGAVLGVFLQDWPLRVSSVVVPVAGAAGATFVLVSVLAIANGVADAVRRGAANDVAVALQREAQIERSSRFSRDELAAMTAALNELPSKSEGRARLVSPELVQTVDTISRGGEAGAQVLARGISAPGIALRKQFRIVEGRPFTPGKLEVIVGRRLARDFAGLTLGTSLTGGTREWSIVGVFESGGGTEESEVWMDLDSARTESGSTTPISSLRVQLLGESELGTLRESVRRSPGLQVRVVAEREYQSRLFSSAAERLRRLAFGLALLLAIGAVAASMNTTSSSIAVRERHVATLRALGFGPSATSMALLLEAMLLGALGGVIGAVGALLVADGYGLSILNSATSTPLAVSATVTSASLVQGIALAGFVSALAAILPCIAVARVPVTAALNIR